MTVIGGGGGTSPPPPTGTSSTLLNTAPTIADDTLQPGVTRSGGCLVTRNTSTNLIVMPGDAWVPTPVTNPKLGSSTTAISRLNFGPSSQFASPLSWNFTDTFNQTAGNLGGKTADLGGAWTTSGGTGDFQVDATAHALTRATTLDASRRIAVLGTAITDTFVEATFMGNVTRATGGFDHGFILRYVDDNNYAYISRAGYLNCIIGGGQVIGFITSGVPLDVANVPTLLRCMLTSDGRYYIWGGGVTDTQTTWQVVGTSSYLASTGVLASGKVGVWDQNTTSIASTRTIDAFRAANSPPQVQISVPVATVTRLDQIVASTTGLVTRLAGTDTAAATLDNRTGAAALSPSSIRLADVLVTSSGVTASSAIRDRRPFATGIVVNGRIATTGGDFTTTNTVGFDAVDTAVRFETSGEGILLIQWSGTVSNNGSNRCVLTVLIDGVAVDQVESTGSTKQSLTGITLLQPGPGSHTAQLAMKVSGGTGTLTRANGARFSVIERFVATANS